MLIRPFLLGVVTAALLAGTAQASTPPAQASAPTLAPLQFANVNGTRLGYRVVNPEASGRTLVLVCGYGVTMAQWHPAFVEELARNRPVVIFDNRGMGNSDGPVRHLTAHIMAIDTIRLIRQLGLRKADLLGWSMGGYIAQRIAIRRPKLIGQMVLAATDPGSPNTLQPAPWVMRRLTGATTPDELLPILFPRSKRAVGRAWFEAIARQPDLAPRDFRTPARTLRQQALANDRRWLGPGNGTYRALHRLRAPTLIVYGARDTVTPPGNSRILARKIRRSVSIRFPNAGHGLLAHAPRVKARTFSHFLDRR